MKSFFLSFLFVLFASTASAADRPNVILILADDMAIGDLSIFNNGLSRTPRLDALVAESVYFENAYSGSPVCAPSRASLFTGRYPHRTGSVTLNQIKFPELTRLHLDETTIADRFSAEGYATGLVGKWHSGPGAAYHPLKRGFDSYIGFNDSLDIKTYYEYQLDVQGTYEPFEGPNLTDVFTEHAIKFVREHRDEPFFLHLAHYAPHRPLSAPQDLIDHYLAKGLPEKTATVYAMIEVMDRGIGELLDELDKLKLAERTLVFFASDNGPDPLVGERFNGTNRGAKYMVTEGGIHVPLMMRWKGKLEPGRREELVHFTDVVPTLMEICDLKPLPNDKPLDGTSFAGLLSDTYQKTQSPELRFWQWNRKTPQYSHNAAVRSNQWKLVRPFLTSNIPKAESTEPPRFYNLTNDPEEQIDLSAEQPELRERLINELTRWSTEVEHDRVHSQPAP
ncbi:MAG: sulfatase-like hydrolase/transferase [Verrucomicrobiales bacterium]|nr:sulfatase-like hydrolase/transferase [Verrucomicrobiales bacterium]